MHATESRMPRPRHRPGHIAAFAFLSLLASAGALAEPAGRVLFVSGNVTATDRAGSVRTLERAGRVEEGDTISTGEGRVQIEFKDGGYFALQPATRFRVDRYRYTFAGDAEDNVLVALVKGGLRTITGLVGKRNRNDYRLDSGVATIGIRGTDYALDLNTSLTGNVAEGAIEVCNGGGCVLVQAGQAFFVPSLNQAPVLGERRALLPPTAPKEAENAAPAAQEAGRAKPAEGFDPVEPGQASPTLPAPRAGNASGGPPPALPPVRAGNAAGGGAGVALPKPPAAAGVPARGGAPAGSPARGTTVAPGLKNKPPGGPPGMSGPPGLIKKDR